MPQFLYANELHTPELVLEFLEHAPHPFLREPTYFFRMMLAANERPVGRINLRASNSELVTRYAGHIGYEVAEEYRGRRLSLRAVEMLLPLARRIRLNPLWITTDPENLASRRICELAGGALVETVTVPPGSLMYEGGARYKARYRLDL